MTTTTATVFAPLTAPVEDDNLISLGAGVGLFTTGLNPMGSDMLMGDGVELFTTGLQQNTGTIAQGAGVGLFTTGLAASEAQVLPFGA
ncbi:hypothetical protein DSM110093_01554 [Sulfitobacter sp. DSM 110093]|uniref:DUF6749 family protein n=1 Tax=Sulfitobacter sp. DSM 110093 TaxID=2883127 RepID=UPI001FADBE26|nr:DUF6749 family protein [Sulfitobacter sp. DSM 110093]UOA31781.1 hypothetical protein DSM110093_01554 [Sulfitobacter sp. DSM 110093]